MTKYADFHKEYIFDNGYGASVVRNQMSYGHEGGWFELAVIKDDKFCYDTSIDSIEGFMISSVIGWLTWDEVEFFLDKISLLPPTTDIPYCGNENNC